MSDEAREEPGAGYPAEGVRPPSPWPPQPVPPQPAPQQSEWEQTTEPFSPNWLPMPGVTTNPPAPNPPEPSMPGASPYEQRPPQPQPQVYGQPAQPPQQPQQPYAQQGPPPQQYGPPPGQYGAGYGQISSPPYGQTSAPPYGQPGNPAQVSGVPGQTSGGPYWAGGPGTPPGVAPAGQQMPTPLPPQPAPGSWTAAQASAPPQQAPSSWAQGSVPPQQIAVPPQPMQSSWPPAQPLVGSPAQPTSTPPQTMPGWTAPIREEPVPDLGDPDGRSSGGRAVIWTIVVAVIVAVLAGVGGYFLGASGKEQAEGGGTKPSLSASPSLGAFERAQATLNKAKFDGDLLPLATPWLADMGGCAANTDTGGPQLPSDETKHVFCRHGGVSVHFAQYRSQTERDASRAFRVQLSYTSPGLAPGQAAPGPKTGGSGAAGEYVEYALKDGDGRALCGIWWNRNDGNAAVFMEALCEEVLGGDWQPFRDLWLRHS